MPKPVSVFLSADDLDLIQALAAKRNNKPAHTSRAFVKDRSPVSLNILGLFGEVAFARFANLPVDLKISPSGDSGYDFIKNGRLIEVKTRSITPKTKYPRLLVRTSHANADVYVLATADPNSSNRVDLVGWCWHHELIRNTITNNFGERFAVSQRNLHPMTKNEMPNDR